MAGRSTAIVLAAGHGRRMNSAVAKQYLLIKGKPVLLYSLQVFEDSPLIDEIVLVAGADELEYCRREIAEKYRLHKIRKIVPGGKERYHSVYNGLCAIDACDIVYIHDGARPFVTQEILQRAQADAETYRACAVGMPVKDTIKICDGEGFSMHTPERARVWQIQTPQVFQYSLIRAAYEKLMEELENGSEFSVTDDAMVVETMTDVRVKLTPGAYSNLKITTPDDLKMAEFLLAGM